MNDILVIFPYRCNSTWVFDDNARGLAREPFVAGIPAIIDHMTANVPRAYQGFRLIFAATPFPGHNTELTWTRAESGGNWYYYKPTKTEGWLCPALFKYFDVAPKKLYAKAEEM